ncbi:MULTISPECIES: hypothetical protein [Rhizobium/Agrobacterium group]|uniref:hypothetical protein n=1 Tax=Rhizobium/Agrobacterium group TaxID=227290 RepID=UPI001F2D4F61|nr:MULTISPECIES: hypothetical protein [Rhizobium/Agrobacterium group]
MSLKLIKRHGGKNWYIRGTIRGVSVDETTGTDDKKRAEEIRIRRETEILDRRIHGIRKTATFLEASVMYLEEGGASRFVDVVAVTLAPRNSPRSTNRQ